MAMVGYRFAVTDDVCRESVLSVPASDPAGRDIDPLELYAAAIDTSDYVTALAPLIRRAVPKIGRLLDVGAGGGQLGLAIHDPALSWTAIEPSPTMRRRFRSIYISWGIVLASSNIGCSFGREFPL